MKTQINQWSTGTVLMIIMMLANLAIMPAHAQGSKMVVAVQTGLGTRSFLIKSDIKGLEHMKTTQQGWESALIIGNSRLRVKTGFGSFKSISDKVLSVKQSSINGLVNFNVLEMMGKNSKYLHPYILTGLSVNTFNFSGTIIPESPIALLLAPACPPCACQLNPVDNIPAAETPTETIENKTNSSRMTSTQLLSGMGMEFSFRKHGYFYSMFSEVRYGLPIGTTTQNAVMNNTQVKNNTTLTFGIAIGLSNYKNNRKIKNGVR